MSDKGYKYPVNDEWKRRVKDEIRTRDQSSGRRGAHAALAREIGCSTGQLTELLSPESKYSKLVPRVHKALGWKEPLPPLPGSRDVGEAAYQFDRLSVEHRKLINSAVDVLRGEHGDEAKQALISVLKMMRK